jgi:hypothetical protein
MGEQRTDRLRIFILALATVAVGGPLALAGPSVGPSSTADEADQGDGWRARVVALQLAAPSFDQRPFQRAPLPATRGTVIKVLIDNPPHPIVSLDRRGSTVSMFADDTGRDLRAAEQDRPGRASSASAEPVTPTALRLSEGHPIAPGPAISRDGQRMVVGFRAPRLPAQAAEKVRVRAKLNLRLGVATNTLTLKNVPLKKGPIERDGVKLKIARMGPSQWGEQPFYVHLQLNGQRAERFVKARVLDTQGRDVTARQQPPIWMADTVQVPVSLKKKLKRATLKLTFYEKLKPLTVPVDVTAGLGLRADDE